MPESLSLMSKLIVVNIFSCCLVVSMVFALDFASKQWVINHLVPGHTKPLIQFLNLHCAHNYGAAFGILDNQEKIWPQHILSVIGIATLVAVLLMMYHRSVQQHLNNCAYALIIGGAIGNIMDRLRYGFVVDFIDVYIGTWHYPTFNLADSFICIGAIIIMIEDCYNHHTKGEKNKN